MRRLIVCFLAMLAGRAMQVVNSEAAAVPESTVIRWRLTAECRASQPLDGTSSREALSLPCRNDKTRDFVALALSGGGAKAAIFAGEAMFFDPRRPLVFMNATIPSRSRGGAESTSAPGCSGIARLYPRRRTPDEFFHFAFNDRYFALLKPSVADRSVAGGVAAAFPALIGNARLIDRREDSEGRTSHRETRA